MYEIAVITIVDGECRPHSSTPGTFEGLGDVGSDRARALPAALRRMRRATGIIGS
jgi:hypothetical protein